MTTLLYTIYGFEGCGYYKSAVELLHSLASKNKNVKIKELAVPRENWHNTLATVSKNHKLVATDVSKVRAHTTSPLIIKGNAYLGGHDNLVAAISTTPPKTTGGKKKKPVKKSN